MEVNLFSARVDMDTEKSKTEPLGVTGVELDDMCCESAFAIEGKYECKPDEGEQTDEHFVTMTKEGPGCYRWSNKKGMWWLCRETENPKYLAIDEKCPYYSEDCSRVKVKKCRKTEVIEGFVTPWGEKFEAVIAYEAQIEPLIERLDKAPYECHRYDGTKMKSDWHYVTIESEGAGVFRWSNRAGVSWLLYETDDPLVLDVSEECPYYKDGHKKVKIVPNDARNDIRALLGPGDEKYDVKGKVTAKVARSPDPTTLPRKYRRNANVGVKKDLSNADYIVIAKAPQYQKGVFMWSNAAGESWLVYSTKDPTKFKVDQECPYTASEGFRTMSVVYNKYGEVVSVEGPSGGLFEGEKCPPLKATFLTLLPLKKYECLKYNGSSKKDDWHYVSISAAGIDPVRPTLRRFLWQNRLGVEWFLYETQDPFIFEVDEKCCYYKEGHTKVHILIGKDGGIESLKGPWGDLYTAVDEFSASGCVVA